MKYLVFVSSFVACLFFIIPTAAQTEECRHLSGLPIPIGASVICGQVRLRGLTKDELRPSVHVVLVVGGVQADRMRVNESGYYYFLRSPSDNSALIFEVNNNEVGRVLLAAGVGSSIRRDIEVDMQSIRSAQGVAPGVVSVQGAYQRSAEAERVFTTAMTVAKAKRTNEAITLFTQIVEKDPKDFVAWTELGTVYFAASKTDDAETSYKRAVALKPDFMPALINLGKLHLSKKAFDKASEVFYKAITVDAKSADAFHYLGESYLQLKQGSKAVIALNEAIRLAPSEKAEIHLRLAALYNAAGAKDLAVNEYKLFLAKVPNHPDKEKMEKYIRENSK